MTEFVLKLRDNSKTGILLAMLGRLVTSQGIDLTVERNGQGIALDAQTDDAEFETTINQLIADAMAGRIAPLTTEEEGENNQYWATVGKELQLSDDGIVQIIKEVRTEHRVYTAA